MADKDYLIKATCVVCNKQQEIRHSFRLTRDAKGMWRFQPVCADCRRQLIADAKATGKFLPFFLIDVSQTEAAKRNKEVALRRSFLNKYAVASEPKPKQIPAEVKVLEAVAS